MDRRSFLSVDERDRYCHGGSKPHFKKIWGDLPITTYGIVNKITTFLLFPIMGMVQGGGAGRIFPGNREETCIYAVDTVESGGVLCADGILQGGTVRDGRNLVCVSAVGGGITAGIHQVYNSFCSAGEEEMP